jgi:hypothetical protein
VLLRTESELVRQLKSAIPRIPPLPRIQSGTPSAQIQTADRNATDVIAASYKPGDHIHNVENIGLEPVWPYNLIGDTSPLFQLARQTYSLRPNPANVDWNYDPIQAARLGLGSEVSDTLVKITKVNQLYINGFAKWGVNDHEFYVEQIANVALALQEALVQDYDGVIRIAPAVPPGWDVDGSVSARFKTTVNVQVRNGIPSAVGLNTERRQPIKFRTPWPGEKVSVTDARKGVTVVRASRASVISFAASAGGRYRIHKTKASPEKGFDSVDGTPATSLRRLGSVQIGLGPA